jgi:endonuclease/exonuclease/phosphatase family metal-dependent hydrolase
MKYLLAAPAQLKPMGTYVGQLQEKWQFPSDHLPIGMTLDDTFHMASWNVLDADYMSWVIEKDSQGLKRSLIADEHVYIGDTGLTVRDQHTARLVLEMTTHPTHPRSLISLQECNEPFLKELRDRLPPNFEILAHEGNAIVVDTNQFQILEAQSIKKVFSADPERTFQQVVLQRLDTQEDLRIVNAHLPGDPNGPARKEFAHYLNASNDSRKVIAMGDMNFNEFEMSEAFGPNSPLNLYTPYCTNISVNTANEPYTSKAIDHFFVSKDMNVKLLDAEETMLGLEATYELLNH